MGFSRFCRIRLQRAVQVDSHLLHERGGTVQP